MTTCAEPPVLVLLPGMDGSGDLFAPLTAVLGDQCELLVMRYPPDQPLGYAALTQWVRAHLPEGRAFVLLGESFSGPLAISLAAQQPPGLCALVLCVSFTRNPRPGLWALRWLLPLLPFKALPAWLLSALLLGRFANPALRQALAQALEPVHERVLRARAEAILRVNVDQELAQVDVPILYLRGDHDRLVPGRVSQRLRRIQPALQVVGIQAPHCLLQVAPVEAAAALDDFLRTVPVPSSATMADL